MITFFNTYFLSFEQFSYQHSNSDIFVYSNFNDFSIIHKQIRNTIPNEKLDGTFIKATFFGATLQNLSISFNALNCSNQQFQDKIFTNYLNIVEGRFPINETEVLFPQCYKGIFNISINSKIQILFNYEFNLTFSISGYYQRGGLSKFIPSSSILVIINNKENEIIQYLNSGMQYYFFLNHRNMDIFNIYGFISELNLFKEDIEGIFSELTNEYIIHTASAIFISNEFSQYIISVFTDLFMILIPICILLILYSKMFSDYFFRIEKTFLEEQKCFISSKEIKRKIFMSLALDNLFSYLIAIPSSISIFYFINLLMFQSHFDYLIFLPQSYYIFTLGFFLINLIVVYLCLVKKWEKNQNNSNTFKIREKKRPQKIIIILGIVVIIPILVVIIQYSFISYYNPILVILNTILHGINSLVSLLYPIAMILIFILIIPWVLIRVIKFLTILNFRKKKDYKFNLMSKFINHKSMMILSFIIFVSLQLGFLNFYNYTRSNSYLQQRNELTLRMGSYIKLSTPFTSNSAINISNYIRNDEFSSIDIIPVHVDNIDVLEKNCILLNLNSSSYYSMLNEVAKSNLEKSVINAIQSLESHEILIPSYFRLSNQLKKGDTLRVLPQNGSDYFGSVSFESYAKDMIIAGFFDFLPGLDYEATLYSPAYSSNLIIITNLKFNFSLEFNDLPISKSYLIKNQEHGIEMINHFIFEGVEIRYKLFENELEILNSMYSTISKASVSIIIFMSVIMFAMMSILLIYNYLAESNEFWMIFQLLNVNKQYIKKFIFWNLIGIFLLSFIIGLTGILSGFIIFFFDNLYLKSNYYFYPLFISLDQTLIIFNFVYFSIMILITWVVSKKLWNFDLKHDKIKKFNPG